MAQVVKYLPAVQETQVRSLGQEDPLEKGMATHFSILAWRICGQRRLASCSPWGHKESKRLTLSLHFPAHINLPFGIYRVSFMHQAPDDIREEH